MTDLDCDRFRTQCAELALGILDGRERAEALDHVGHCARCRHELLLVGDLADGLAELSSAAEPPAGFETRVLATLRSQASRDRPYRRGILPRVAAAIVVVVAGLGGWAVGHHASHGPTVAIGPLSVTGGRLAVAELMSSGQPIGRVILSSGRDPWISLAVDSSLGNQTVICRLGGLHGKSMAVGSLPLLDGSGYWAAAVPPHSFTVTEAELVAADGRIVATASVPAIR